LQANSSSSSNINTIQQQQQSVAAFCSNQQQQHSVVTTCNRNVQQQHSATATTLSSSSNSISDFQRRSTAAPEPPPFISKLQQQLQQSSAAFSNSENNSQQQQQQQQQQSHLGSCQSPVMLQFGAQHLSTFASPEADVDNQTHHVVDGLSPAQPANEDFEQDEMSQPDSSEDEDFSPSEFEQDEMSQPESSSSEEDAFEMDEMSQPESSSEDEPTRERAPTSRPSSAAQRAESKSKSSQLRPVSEQQLARLGFPKAAQPATDGVPRSSRLSQASAKKKGLQTSGRKRSSKHALLVDDDSAPRQTKSKRERTSLACDDLHPDNDRASHDRQRRRVREQPGQRHASNAAQQVSNCLSQLCCFSSLFTSYT